MSSAPSNIAVIPAPRPKSVLVDMSDRYGMEPNAFEATVRAICIKPDRNGRVASREEFAAFLLVAKQYGLNPLTKEIFAFVDKGAVVPIVSVDGWANLINSNPAFDGMSFDEQADHVTCNMYRKDRSHPISVSEWMDECKRDTIPWNKWPRRMLRHKAMIQTARYAFGFAGIYDEDEADRIVNAKPISQGIQPPAPPPIAMSAPAAPTEAVDGKQQEVPPTDFAAIMAAYKAAVSKAKTEDEIDDAYNKMMVPLMNEPTPAGFFDEANTIDDARRGEIDALEI